MAYQGGKLANGTPLNVAVYQAYKKAGLSHNQALAITAEVGRENSFRSNILFGNHTDPARNKNGKKIRNLGMLSWNQGRDNMLEGYLKKNGVMKNGVMEQSQANLDAQAQFSVREMKSKKYKGKLKGFFSNPNASPESYAAELGQNYIVWAYGQNTVKGDSPGTRVPFNWKANDNNRRGYLNTLSGMLGGDTNYQAQDNSWQEPEWQTQQWSEPEWQAPDEPQWQEPQWQSLDSEPQGFIEPQEQGFIEPEWQTLDDTQASVAPVRSMADSEPTTWQEPNWQTLEPQQPNTMAQPRQL